jgi:hypothetical protein
MMRRLHAIVGTTAIAAFVATGLYMRVWFPGAYQGDGVMRMSFRATHVYLLFSGLLNLLLGLYYRETPSARTVQRVGSWLMLGAPGLLLASFFVEAAPGRLDRPMAVIGVVLTLAASVLHVFATTRRPRV